MQQSCVFPAIERLEGYESDVICWMKICCRTKIRNIEATEEAKQRLMAERLSRREKGVSDFVPTNVAVNFVQHNRCNGWIFHFVPKHLQPCVN